MAEDTSGARNIPLDEAARVLYLAVLRDGGRIEAAEVSAAEQASLNRLEEFGLLVRHPGGPRYVAVSPRAVTSRIGAEMRAEAVRLMLGSEHVADEFDDLIRAYDGAASTTVGPSGTDVVHGFANIQNRIAQLVSDCQTELITLQPGHRSPELLETALHQDIPFLQRGGVLRTLYQPSALSAPATVCYAAEVTKYGGAVRVLDEPFQRTFILDRRVAVIPVTDDTMVAAFIEEPTVVAHLLRVFERDWARAESVRWNTIRGDGRGGAAAERVGTLLSQGLTQQGVARRLGLSERTVAGHIARLRNRYGARTLYQLGWLMRAAAPAGGEADGDGEDRA